MPRNHLNDLSVPFKKSEYHHLLLHVHGLHISKAFYESGVEFLFSYIGYFFNTLESEIDVVRFIFDECFNNLFVYFSGKTISIHNLSNQEESSTLFLIFLVVSCLPWLFYCTQDVIKQVTHSWKTFLMANLEDYSNKILLLTTNYVCLFLGWHAKKLSGHPTVRYWLAVKNLWATQVKVITLTNLSNKC